MTALILAYPHAKIEPETAEVYCRLLSDLPVADLELATIELARTRRSFPAVAEIVDLVLERRLRLPTPEEAWEQAQRYAVARNRYEPCPVCDGLGQVGDDAACLRCRGTGEIEVERSALRSLMPEPVLRAFDFVGGQSGITEADAIAVVRAHFVKAYVAFRVDAMREANLAELVPAPDRPALAAG